MRTNIRPHLIDAAIQRHYRTQPLQLSTKDVERRTKAIEALVAVSQQGLAQVKTAKTELINKLEGEQTRLLRLHVEEGDTVSPNAFRKERARLDREIEAAKKSLAATEDRLRLDGTVLRMALELAGDIAEVYGQGAESLKRGYNQALFKKLYVLPEWDDELEQTVAKVSDAELTRPYAVLLAEDFAGNARRAVAAIRRAAGKAEGSPDGAAFWRSVFDLDAYGGEGGIRTLERACAPYSLSRRVPSATRPPLRARKP
jgi:hypothetical protein